MEANDKLNYILRCHLRRMFLYEMCISRRQKGNVNVSLLKEEALSHLGNDLKSIRLELILQLPPPRGTERSRGSESDCERIVPLWLNPRWSNRNQVLDSINVFPCIFVGNAALTDWNLTKLHALSFNETIDIYACHANFTFLIQTLPPASPRFYGCFMTLKQTFVF